MDKTARENNLQAAVQIDGNIVTYESVQMPEEFQIQEAD